MQVKRTDLYDFAVVLDEAEFDLAKNKAAELHIEVEDVLLDMFTCGFSDYLLEQD